MAKQTGVYYSSAVKNGTLQYNGLPPTESFEVGAFSGFRCNFIRDPQRVLDRLRVCDVVYCEPPFPAGVKVFDKRANETTANYAAFGEAFGAVLRSLEQPRYVVVNKRLLGFLDSPTAVCPIRLNGADVDLGVWGGDVPPSRGFCSAKTNLAVCSWLGKKYTKMGDFTCGYGTPLVAFANSRGGNSFVASDYDPRCVTVVRRRVELLVGSA